VAGISTRAPIGQSIVTVYAKDQDSFGGVKYGIQSGNSLNGASQLIIILDVEYIPHKSDNLQGKTL
jgi:hypothetical protein